MKKIKLDKISSVFKNVNLPTEVLIDNKIVSEEGTIIVVQAGDNLGKMDAFEFVDGRLGKLIKGDVIPGVLGYRKAPVEFAGIVPKKIMVGDELSFLCEGGLIGEISGIYEAWGKPMKVKVLGAMINTDGKPMNLKYYALPQVKSSPKRIPIICFLATRMDSGKTTLACKIAHHFKQLGKRIVAIKPTGVSYMQDPYKLMDNGVEQVFDFTDMGLPSTCGPDANTIIKLTQNLLNHAKITNPDLILMEFGEGILGEYHVMDILKSKPLRDQISFVVLAANDFTGIYGAREILKKQCKMDIDLITGPIANSHLGVELIKKYFKIEAESNLHEIHKTPNLINKKVFS
ncbi:hypothetical protein A3C26_01640 [Candidatus Daviesbacteria bacterium RIFCSPHIGHO2_02_FULL_39_12]|uniref:DUF1611 domain-containing protein n=2 Tax=Candidatus Daviesiibacteriota TaxID=1752718 RepID=A0A1F5JCS9_9BACT|nr:MAG: hypothetical protein A3C26_01640 [Candidatus Daviesbacteria bacterium RIFCSPHIGHO2_02_FULL_39_12]OGE72878.1 MAG: hypothetical protein A3H40_01880 [Candidatus Daviesbacteria bacterium RIFCSPLOWO2_02_FULL_38_15]